MYISIMLIVYLPLFGENSIGYNYVRTRYKWGVEEYSNYRTIAEVIDITGHVIFLPLFGVMKFRDSLKLSIRLSIEDVLQTDPNFATEGVKDRETLSQNGDVFVFIIRGFN